MSTAGSRAASPGGDGSDEGDGGDERSQSSQSRATTAPQQPEKPRPSGRSTLKPRFIGVTPASARPSGAVPPPAPGTHLAASLQIAPRRAYLGAAAPIPPEIARADRRAREERARKEAKQLQEQEQLQQQAQQKRMGRPRHAGVALLQAQQELPSGATATDAPPQGSLSARATPIAGRRASGARSGSSSGASTARVAVAVPRVRPLLPLRASGAPVDLSATTSSFSGSEAEEKSGMQPQQLPAWLHPSGVLPPLPGVGPAAVDAFVAPAHPHTIALPRSHYFQFYSPPPSSAARARETRQAAAAVAAAAAGEGSTAQQFQQQQARSYMYEHRLQREARARSRSNSPQRLHAQQAALLSASGSPAAALSQQVAPADSWSTFPFVNPRLIRAPAGLAPPGSAAADANEPNGGVAALVAPPVPVLPGVPRLFGSVVGEHERAMLFEYLRSTHSHLFAWPPIPTQAAMAGPDSGQETADPSASAALPAVVFSDAQLERLVEEGRSALGALVLLRRLDAELAAAGQAGSIGMPIVLASRDDGAVPAELAALVAARPPPQHFHSADALCSALEATRLYLTELRRTLFQWCCAPGRSLFALRSSALSPSSAAAAASGSADADAESPSPTAATAASGTLFLTQQMVDSLLNEALASGYSSEEELWMLLARWDRDARREAVAEAGVDGLVESATAQERTTAAGFASFDDLIAAVKATVAPAAVASAVTGDAAEAHSPSAVGGGSEASSPFLTRVASLNLSVVSEGGIAPLPSSSPPAPPLTPAQARVQAAAMSYARLLVFKFLRDDTASTSAVAGVDPMDDLDNGSGTGGGAALFSQAAHDVVASVAQMDALIHATRGLTLGQRYHQTAMNMAAAAAAAAPAAQAHAAAPGASATGMPGSRHTTRPSSPMHDLSGGNAPTAASSPAASSSLAAITRSFGVFLAARCVRVLRSLLFHGCTHFRSFDDLILAAHTHTRKMHAERAKVFHYLTASTAAAAGVPASSKSLSASLGSLPPPKADGGPLTPELVGLLQQLTRSNASGAVGLFDAYYAEADRRERARAVEERLRAQQIKQNTHQFGSTGLASSSPSSLIPLPALSSSGASSARLVRGEHKATKDMSSSRAGSSSTLPLPMRGMKHSPSATKGAAAHAPSPATTSTSSSAAATTTGGHVRQGSSSDAGERPSTQQTGGSGGSGGTDPGAIRAAAHAAAQALAQGLPVPPLNSYTISRYASAKTLPYTASKSALLKHSPGADVAVDPAASSAEGSFSSSSAGLAPLPPLVITPEDVDALFGGFEHLLTAGAATATTDEHHATSATAPSAPVSGSSSPLLSPSFLSGTSSVGAAGSPPSSSGLFDPLLEQGDEDLLLAGESPEESWNAMDLTRWLQQYKQERPLHAISLDGAGGAGAGGGAGAEGGVEYSLNSTQPSYLANHPLLKPMLDQAVRELNRSRGAASTAATNTSGDAVFVVRSGSQKGGATSAAVSSVAPAVLATKQSSPQQRFSGVEASLSSEEAALARSEATNIPTLESLLNPQPSQPQPHRQSPPAQMTSTAGTSVTVLRPREPASASSEEPAAVSVVVTPPAAATVPTSDAEESHLLSPRSAATPAVPSITADHAAAATATPAEAAANDTSRDLIVLDPQPESGAAAAADNAKKAPASAEHAAGGGAAAGADAAAPPVPKMLPVVLQTLSLLRGNKEGKIKLHTGASTGADGAQQGGFGLAPQSGNPRHGPAGAGVSGVALGPFVPHSGAVIPGGSIGSMKTLFILRELSASGRKFFSANQLVATVCAMRAERKWARAQQRRDKKRLLAAGVTVAQVLPPSGMPNELSAPEVVWGIPQHAILAAAAAHGARRRGGAPSMGAGTDGRAHAPFPSPSSPHHAHTSSAPPISATQFMLLSSPHALAGQSTRTVHVVDEEADETTFAGGEGSMGGKANDEYYCAGGDSAPGTSPLWSSACTKLFLPATAFPSSVHMHAFPPPSSSGSSSSSTLSPRVQKQRLQQQAAGRSGSGASSGGSFRAGVVDHDGSFRESSARAWGRSRLLAHLSTLLLFQHDATAPKLLPHIASSAAAAAAAAAASGAGGDGSGTTTESGGASASTLESQAAIPDATEAAAAAPVAGEASPSAGAPAAPIEVQIRMSELEQLLDALDAAPREARSLAQKLARLEREQAERAAALAPVGSAAHASSLAALDALLPLEHPLAALLALLSWMDQREISFRNMAQLIRTVASGAWTALYNQTQTQQRT